MKQIIVFATLMLLGAGCELPWYTEESMMTSKGIAVEEQEVVSDAFRGMYYVPAERSGKLPGVLVIHEWWGLNDQIKEESKKLAAEGYAVFAIDLYDGEVAADSKRAGELVGAVRANPDGAEAKMKAALDFLATQPDVAGERLASLGWCFGGGMSGLIGSSGDARLRATVIYYGTPVTDSVRLSKMTQPVLGIWGADDQSIPVASVQSFESSLKAQGTDANFHIYEGAGHAFANPTRSDSYRPEATADAWAKTLAFLKKNLNP